MPTYIVTRKSDGAEVYRYEAPVPIEFIGFEFATHDHAEAPPEPPAEQPTVVGRVMSKLAYLRLFTQTERIAIRNAAEGSDALKDYLELLNIAEEVNTADPDIQAALRMLEAVGLIGAGRADEILGSA
jgi:hypothetical protein